MIKPRLPVAVVNDLLERVAQGDRDAFRLLDLAVHTLILHHVRHLLHDHHVAEEVTQEAMLRVWVVRHRFDASRSGLAWIYRIATNLAIDLLRKPSLRRLSNVDVERLATDVNRDDPAIACAIVERVEAVQAAIEALPEQERVAVELRLEGCTFDAIGRELGLHMLAARRRYVSAMHHLQDALLKHACA